MFDSDILKKLVRFEVDPSLYSPYNEDAELRKFDNFRSTYRPTYQDLVVACRNMLDARIDRDTMIDWYFLVYDELNDLYEGIWSNEGDLGYLWPDNDYYQFKAMDNAFDFLVTYYEQYDTDEEIQAGIKEIMCMAENYTYNIKHDPIEWKMTKIQRMEILEICEDHTERVPDSRKALFKRIVEEECDSDNTAAMRIKAYSCYGGDSIFDCDWEESKKWLTRLFEKEENPYYANSLGYIYYYGRCNNGTPEYDKAFQYFSIGAARDIYESMYKMADMFRSGNGCIKSQETADYIIFKLYYDSRPKFCNGEDAKFADIALRFAAILQRKEIYEEALYHYIEADYAIKKRLEKSDFFGDEKVQENILNSIRDVKEHLEEGYLKESIRSRNPYWLTDMLSDNCYSKAVITYIGDNRYKIRIDRSKKENASKAFVVSPEIGMATRTWILETEFVTDVPVMYLCDDTSNMYVDNIRHDKDGEYWFCSGNTIIFKIFNADFILENKDFLHDSIYVDEIVEQMGCKQK